jgi:hypothetical protein
MRTFVCERCGQNITSDRPLHFGNECNDCKVAREDKEYIGSATVRFNYRTSDQPRKCVEWTVLPTGWFFRHGTGWIMRGVGEDRDIEVEFEVDKIHGWRHPEE